MPAVDAATGLLRNSWEINLKVKAINNIDNDAMETVIKLLQERGYNRIQRFPLRKYPVSLALILNEIGVMGRFLTNGNNTFSISLNPQFLFKFSLKDELGFLREAFFMNKAFSTGVWSNFFSKEVVDSWKKNKLLSETEGNKLRFDYRIVPYDGLYFVTSRFDRNDIAFTFLSYDSLYFASFLKRRLKDLSFHGEKGMDLCCGVGVQALSISYFCKEVTGIDLNQNAVALAKLNASINGVKNCHFKEGSLFEKTDTRFDLIVANPPFIFFKEGDSGPIDSDGGKPFGLGITLKILAELDKYLTVTGRAFIITRSPIIKGKDYLSSNITKLLPGNFGCRYHYISDSINKITEQERALNISGYRQVILEIFRGRGNKVIRYSFIHRKMSLF